MSKKSNVKRGKSLASASCSAHGSLSYLGKLVWDIARELRAAGYNVIVAKTNSKTLRPQIKITTDNLPKNRLEFETLPDGRVMLDLDKYQIKFRFEISHSPTRYEIGFTHLSLGKTEWALVSRQEFERVEKHVGLG